MAGLMSGLGPSAGMMGSTAMTPPGEGDPTVQPEGEAPTPEQQQAYDEFVGRALLLIFDEKKQEVRKAVTKLLKQGEPKDALAQTTAMVYERVAQEARQSGVQIDPDVRDGAITEIFETLAEIATDIGVHDFVGDDDAFEGAYYAAMDATRVAEQEGGGIDQEAEMNRFRAMEGAF